MFITFEGPDGSGKSTALKSLTAFLTSQGIDFVLTREPGDSTSKEARKIREIILDPENNITPMTEAILYAADRRLHLENTIWPALKANRLVLCDRYLDSSLAYQGVGRNLGFDKILALQEVVTEMTFPDLTILFDIAPLRAAERVDNRQAKAKDRLELENDDFREQVYRGYHEVLKRFPERVVSIDATKSENEVFEAVKTIVLRAISKK